MKLLVVSHTEHYLKNGTVVGWGPTVREIDHLANLFDEIIHIAMLHTGPAPDSAIAYQSPRVKLCPVPSAGGSGLTAKLRIMAIIPGFIRKFLRELRTADIVHVRCPANISMIAIVLLALKRNPPTRWIKYAGNWQPRGPEAWSYAFQRWWLKTGFHRGLVTVNGRWPAQPRHVFSFVNPCLTQEELMQAQSVSLTQQLSTPMRLIYVGRLESAKGAGRALDILASLGPMGLSATLDLIGDGPERAAFELKAEQLGVKHLTRFHGWMPRTALVPLYAQSHFMILPCTSSEGWPKVLSEAMAYGVIPIAGNVSSIPQLLEAFGAGRAIEPENVKAFCQAIQEYYRNPAGWKGESANAVKAAASFTYDRYLEAVRSLLGLATNCEA